ncbi:MAG TPA: Sapep family Mn(2+)-dependent dipeptidase [Ligilactobacillus acidipiscis]|uniref:Sapep family Mn(2+)-dependent dipeptidase n=1 Tax=Ligilactobacillus acidipiscis TaxID=89059 RepID=A0A921F7W7_9LACO|nr:Sapep family Mn(2+)-dependent dipeptidase [Ligilactobacillus acidipiscis]
MLKASIVQNQINTHKLELLKDLKILMQNSSVTGISQETAPFGKDVRKILDIIVSLGKTYGFKTKIVNDAMAYVQWGNDNDNYVAIVGHLDVVNPGEGWSYPPFDLSEKQGVLYGRGILDNKGPIFSCLFGMKLLKDMGFKPQRTIRIIFGSDEESGSRDVALYLEKEKPPYFGFTPDCKFPVVYGERGIVSYEIQTSFSQSEIAQISQIQGNQSADHVPDNLKVEVNGSSLNIKGKRTPTNAPEMGENAITYLAKEIIEKKLVKNQIAKYFDWLYKSFHKKHFGQGLGITFSDEESGKLIQTPYQLIKEGNNLILDIAIRYPVSINEEQITKKIAKAIYPGSELKIIRSFPSVLHDKNSNYIKQLSQVYAYVMGKYYPPVTTTGATYARTMPNIVAFGPSFPGQKGIAHKQDEWLKTSDLLKMLEIYMQSIYVMTIE